MRLKPLKSQQFDSLGARNMRVMKVFCPECNNKATIRKTVRKHRHISDIYCACDDVECGHTFVLNMTFSHTLSPSAKTSDKLLQTVIENLSPKQRQMAFELLKVQA
ncbi:ogr/Delta-like zinc finger family protein [Pectobacterium aroidearum]|uniref:ogr/Delta-like zinc finger family protein n=1 Tax=Pectobacterium aroidearum TaxID=1201031 RepID=UPI002A7FC642|nr:ogr/Delta-like zinc finger family protein [Pectobacterium aroidearum]MDY4387747.1 ogr/Delta-like zinc finger family protein [Pectobacterium aroidearum]